MAGFADLAFTMQMRDIVNKMIADQIETLRPKYRYATVQSIDRANYKCNVIYNGETGTRTVNMGSIQPNAVGQIVRIEGIGIDKFITDVIGGETYNGVRYGTIEPLYSSGEPRVTWEGDTTLSGPYPVEGGYRPQSGDTVIGINVPGHGLVLQQAFALNKDQFSPRWNVLPLQNNWYNYNIPFPNGFEATWPPVSVTKTSSGIVIMRGLFKKDTAPALGEVICNLPVGYRPGKQLMMASQSNSTGACRIDVLPTGDVRYQSGNQAWMSAYNIIFPSSDVAPEAAWTYPTLLNGFQNYVDVYGGGFAKISYWKDSNGLIWRRGLGYRSAAVTNLTPIFSVADHVMDYHQVARITAADAYGRMTYYADGSTRFSNPTPVNYFSFDGNPQVPRSSPVYNTFSGYNLGSGWSTFDSSYSQPGYYTTPDRLILHRGLVKSATAPASGTVLANIPNLPGMADRLFVRRNALHAIVSNDTWARIDSASDGTLVAREGCSNAWIAMDSAYYVADQI